MKRAEKVTIDLTPGQGEQCTPKRPGPRRVTRGVAEPPGSIPRGAITAVRAARQQSGGSADNQRALPARYRETRGRTCGLLLPLSLTGSHNISYVNKQRENPSLFSQTRVHGPVAAVRALLRKLVTYHPPETTLRWRTNYTMRRTGYLAGNRGLKRTLRAAASRRMDWAYTM